MPHGMASPELAVRLAGREPIALLDIREMGEYRKCHIQGSTPLPLGDLESRGRRYVPGKDLPVVVYGVDDGREADARKLLLRMGFTHVNVLEGGLDAWAAGGGACAVGWGFEGKQFGEHVGVAEAIPHVTADELAREMGEGVIVLDTRTEAEFEKGHLPGAFRLPPFRSLLQAAEICTRYRTVYVNCAGRTRSILGARLLRTMGFANVFAVENGTWGWIHSGRKLEKGAGRRMPDPSPASLEAARAHAARIASARSIEVIAAQDAARRFAPVGAHYIVDIRSGEAFARGHVPGAFHIEGGLLQFLAEERFAVRSLPVLVAGQDTADAVAAAALLHDLGYRAAALDGGFGAWSAAGLAGAHGEQAWDDEDLSIASSVPIMSWNQAAPRIGKGAVLVDVRALGEFALAHVDGSRSVPLGLLRREALKLQGLGLCVVAGNGSKARRGAAILAGWGLRAAALAEPVEHLPALGVSLVEGIEGSGASLDEAKEDVDPFRRRGALRQTVAESHAYLEWESALSHGVTLAPPMPIATT